MAGANDPEPSATYVRVSDSEDPVHGVRVKQTETAMLVTDCGRQVLPTQSFGALAVTTTAQTLANLNGADLSCARGIQLKAASTNTANISVGGSSVAASATASAVNGMPLAAGDTIFLEITQLSSLYADAATGTQYLHWIAY